MSKGFPQHSLELKVNDSLPWNFDIDAGGVRGKLDFKNINLEELNLNMGAGKVEIYLGAESTNCDINIASGVSQVVLHIPNESGVKLEFDGALNRSNLLDAGLVKQGETTYVSVNYPDASSRYNIDAHMGLGDFKIQYYIE